ncbi:pentatricopeptide repeat-containing protein At3g12770-like isoform X1 [Zingiber officinale]|uniref:Pentatricopeptide repeat-containing protein n=1 Tax=Zingiber officinale TaxID=94328 RepID=A0A8J5LN03_ZINOF|nr:pentatricopeptide repeat-containing protein At3g12770-like isoform X1 [Zingiber officinale]KAG6532165.1 hypothetical protein ZIOFF_006003 [Zingiber officinale]
MSIACRPSSTNLSLGLIFPSLSLYFHTFPLDPHPCPSPSQAGPQWNHLLSSLECGRLLESLTNSKSLRHGLQIHGHMVASGVLVHNTYLRTKLCAMYAACGRVRQARAIFDAIAHRSTFLWNVMIRGYAFYGQPLRALLLYRQMLGFGHRADKYTYPFVLMACGDPDLIKVGKGIHSQIAISGYADDVFVANSLLSMYSKCGRMKCAQKVFDRMPVKDLTTSNTMISGYARNNDPLSSLMLFSDTLANKGQWDEASLLGVLPACANLMALKQGREIHAHMLRSGLRLDGFLCNALIDLYSKSKFLIGARRLFDAMSSRDAISWNSIISGCARHGNAAEGLALFCQMNMEGVPPDTITLLVVLGACSRMLALTFGMSLHAHIIRRGHRNMVYVGTALVNLYAKCGSLESSRQVFDEMPVKNLVSWSAMISGYGLHGRGKEAVACFNEMKEHGIRPDEVSFTSILSACSHTGLVNEGKEIFYEMSKVYFLKPKAYHYSCIVDILGRAGDLEDAYSFIIDTDLDAMLNADVWEALLSACKIHHNVELAEIAAQNIISLKPKHIGPYVNISNMYAMEKRWTDVEKVRALAELNGLKKQPGYSFLDSDIGVIGL